MLPLRSHKLTNCDILRPEHSGRMMSSRQDTICRWDQGPGLDFTHFRESWTLRRSPRLSSRNRVVVPAAIARASSKPYVTRKARKLFDQCDYFFPIGNRSETIRKVFLSTPGVSLFSLKKLIRSDDFSYGYKQRQLDGIYSLQFTIVCIF